jgi:hypothetical protein
MVGPALWELVNLAEGQSLRGLAQHVELLSQDKDLGF